MGRIKRYRTALSRHHRSKGHGIHSPHAFNFVRFVLREKCPYYSYEELEQLRHAVIESQRHVKHHRRVISSKGMKMIFRVTNYFNPQRCMLVGTCYGITAATMLSVASTSSMWLYEPQLDSSPIVAQVLLPCINRIEFYNDCEVALSDYCNNLNGDDDTPFVLVNSLPNEHDFNLLSTRLAALLNQECVIMLRNLSRSRAMKQLWKVLKGKMTHGQSFTNEKTAIIVSNPKLNLEHFFLWF